jgi:hypothetical protein
MQYYLSLASMHTIASLLAKPLRIIYSVALYQSDLFSVIGLQKTHGRPVKGHEKTMM